MKGKIKFLLNVLIVCVMWYIPFKIVKSIEKRDYLDHNFDAFIGSVNFSTADDVISCLLYTSPSPRDRG